jgi:hypothetical protein
MCCEMTVKRMEMLGVNVRKMKALRSTLFWDITCGNCKQLPYDTV